MTPSALFDLINATTAASGGSLHGLSKDDQARKCGMAAAFSAALPAHTFDTPRQFYDANNKPRVIGNRAGSAFHALRELQHAAGLVASELPSEAAVAEEDAAVAAAIMAFKRCSVQERHDGDYFGTSIAAEFPVEGPIANLHRTGRLDRVMVVSQQQADRWADYGVLAAEPGTYAWDWKLHKAVTHALADEHSRSLQAAAYMHLYEQKTGVRLRGFVFDLTSRAANPKESRLFVLVPNLADLRIVEWHVTRAEVARAAGEANVAACDSRYGACPFIGSCPRFGTAAEHSDIISNYALLRQAPIESEGDE